MSRGFLYNILKAVTARRPPGFPQLPPEGSPSFRRQKPDVRNRTVGSISHLSGPKLIFWGNFTMVLHGFASRSPKNIVFPWKLESNIKKWKIHYNSKLIKIYWTNCFLEGALVVFLVRVTLGLFTTRCQFWRHRIQGPNKDCFRCICDVFVSLSGLAPR